MATMVIGQGGSGPGAMQVLVDYSAGGGGITINGLSGSRSDRYTTSSTDAGGTVYINIGGNTTGCNPRTASFPSNSNWSGWANCYASVGGLAGNTGIAISFSGWSASNINNSAFYGTIDAGHAAPFNVSINPVADRTSINLNRNWSNATACQYNIAGWGWIGENSSYGNGVYVSANSVSNLTPNTSYSCQVAFYNYEAGPTYSNSATVTTTGNSPSLNSTSASPSRTSCNINYNASYETNASLSSVHINYGTSTSYGSSTTSTSLSNLSPNTTYYYSIYVTDNWGRNSNTATSSFKTTCNVPSALSLVQGSNTSSSISVVASATGDTNAAITNYTVYYKKTSDSTYSSANMGTSNTYTINNLVTDTNYNAYFTATNAAGTTTSSVYNFSTSLSIPTISTPVVTNILPFSCTVNGNTSINPTRIIKYLFSKDGGSTWAQNKENLFNLNNWSINGVGVTSGSCAFTSTGIAITANSNNSYTNTAINATSDPSRAQIGLYGTPVVGGQPYVLAYTPSVDTSSTQCYIMWYDSNFTYISLNSNNDTRQTSRRILMATSPANAAYANIRFDNDTAGTTVSFNDIYFGSDSTGSYVPYANSNSYNWTGLTEETSYSMVVKAIALNTGSRSYPVSITSATVGITTPADQAKIRCKIEGTWEKGKTYFKKDGSWIKAKKIYTKINGEWKLGTNYDS